jgi:proline utilization trans-activator
MFRAKRGPATSIATSGSSDIPRFTSALAETCVHTARHSHRLLTKSWVTGALPALDYLSAQYTFAAAVVLLLSSITFSCNAQNDQNDFESSAHLLNELKRNGNIAAIEFSEHLDLVVQAVAVFEGSSLSTVQQASATTSLLLTPNINPPARGGSIPSMVQPARDDITTEMALFGPLVQDFLTQGDTELGLPFMLENDAFLDGFDWSGANLES